MQVHYRTGYLAADLPGGDGQTVDDSIAVVFVFRLDNADDGYIGYAKSGHAVSEILKGRSENNEQICRKLSPKMIISL